MGATTGPAARLAAPPDQRRASPGPEARERLLHRLWREQRLAGRPLPADDGSRIQVLFPGWPNSDRGPDFRGALLATAEGRLLRGDVEVHVHARDWRLHGHHQDPAYGDVILHVAWRGRGAAGQARTATGARVPTVALEGVLELPLEVLLLAGHAPKADPRPCVRHGPLDHGSVAAVLEREGERRFLGKAAALAGDAAARGPEEALYRGCMDALGYSQNRRPFRELAERAPFAILAGLAAGKAPGQRQAVLEAFLFGAGGLLPSQRALRMEPEPDVERLEGLWRALGPPGLAPLGWHSFGVRPENAPPRRVAAAAALVERFLPTGLVAGLRGLLAGEPGQAPSTGAGQALPALRRALTLAQDGYWAHHIDFGRGGSYNPTLLGSSRASDIVVNVALPFLYAWAEDRGDARMQGRCLELYRAHPPLSPNRITREMERMLLPEGSRKVVTNALRQQGLIGLYKRRCLGLLCEGCAFAGQEPETVGTPFLQERGSHTLPKEL